MERYDADPSLMSLVANHLLALDEESKGDVSEFIDSYKQRKSLLLQSPGTPTRSEGSTEAQTLRTPGRLKYMLQQKQVSGGKFTLSEILQRKAKYKSPSVLVSADSPNFKEDGMELRKQHT
jgi:hypothetical protein